MPAGNRPSIVLVTTPWREAELIFGPDTWSRCEIFARGYVRQQRYATRRPHILNDTPRARRCWLRRMGMKEIVTSANHQPAEP